MHQAVLVHTYVDEGAKGGDVADRAFEHHAFFQIFDVFDAVVETRHLEVRARVTARLFQLGEDVFDCDDAEFLVGKQLGAQRFEHVGTAHELGHRLACVEHDLLDHGVGFGVNAGAVQRVAAGVQTQKPGALLEGLGAQAGHFEQVGAAAKGAVGVTPAHHRLGHRLAQARHTGQQRHAGGVQVHAHAVDAILDHRVQAARQLALVHIVLVLAHADGLGVDLHQLGQRVLQSPRNAGRATQADVHVRHFLRGKFTGRIHRRTRLADHHLVDWPVGAG